MREYLLIILVGILAVGQAQSAPVVDEKLKNNQSTTPVAKKNPKDPYIMVAEVSRELFSKISAQHDQIVVNPNILRAIVYTDLMPHADTYYSSLKVLGQYARKISKAERKKFAAVFGKYMASNLAQVLTLYSNQQIIIEKPKVLKPKQKFVTVRVDVVSQNAPKIELVFSLRKNKKTQEWGTYDLMAEGISIIRSKQAEWRPQIKKEGITAVIAKLEELAKLPITIKNKAK